ncbi:winged helix-turn-helix transcriptional regulator [Bacillus sp. BGMRC 2118]|nr:winged helix-turn-helix transcriptional regulator [Bacillus sp. BGMRC 2118]
MKRNEVCEVTCVHEDTVNKVSTELIQQNTFEVATLFKALADETRLKIAYSLTIEEELCVCDVANIIGSSTATASHHLRLFSKLGLAKSRKKGKLVYYSLDDEHVKQLINIAFEHQKEVEHRGSFS